ncbi:MAG: hypothetical protein KDJ77_01100, partial [Rhodobiaceae bacterium]|nr:hypothetical protein [Rhodobiaceae bacterium]
MAIDYYLRLDSLDGDVEMGTYAGWFEVEGFDFGISSSGVPQFTKLSVDIDSDADWTALDRQVLKGTALPTGNLVAVDEFGQVLSDWAFSTVHLTDSDVTTSNSDISRRIALTYDSFEWSILTAGGSVESAVFDISSALFNESITVSVGGAWQLDAAPSDTADYRFFLKLGGGTNWTEIGGFGLDLTTTGGPGSFTIASPSNDANPLLAYYAAAGIAIPDAEIEIWSDTATGWRGVAQYELTDVRVTNATTEVTPGSADETLTLAFREIGESTITGIDTPTETAHDFGWDAALSKETGGQNPPTFEAPANSATGDLPPPAYAGPAAYYFKLDGVTGDVASGTYADWFEVEGFKFGVANSGAPSFTELSVSLDSDIDWTALDKLVLKGTFKPTGQLVAVDSGGQVLSDWMFSNVHVTESDIAATGGDIRREIAIDYSAFKWEILTAAGTMESADFNVTANAFSETFSAPLGGAWELDPATEHTGTYRYYLKAGSGTNWTEVTGFDLHIDAVSGVSSFDIDRPLDDASPLLAFYTAAGVALPQVEVEIWTETASGWRGVAQYQLDNVRVQSTAEDATTPGTADESLAFVFDEFGETVVTGIGTAGETDHDFGWDLAHRQETGGQNPPNFDAPANTTTGDLPAPAYSGPVSYYLRISNLDGDVETGPYTGWFQVEGYRFGISGIGASNFTDLTVDLDSDIAWSALDRAALRGIAFPTGDLVAVDGGGHILSAWSFSNILLPETSITAADGDIAPQVKLTYESFEWEILTAAGTMEKATFDIASSVFSESIGLPVGGAWQLDVNAPDTATYRAFMKAGSGTNWTEIDGFSLDIATIGGPGDFSIARPADDASPLLAFYTAKGTILPQVEIEVFEDTGSGWTGVAQYVLLNAHLSGAADDAQTPGLADERLTISFTEIRESIVTDPGTPNETAHAFGWNVASRIETGAQKPPTFESFPDPVAVFHNGVKAASGADLQTGESLSVTGDVIRIVEPTAYGAGPESVTVLTDDISADIPVLAAGLSPTFALDNAVVTFSLSGNGKADVDGGTVSNVITGNSAANALSGNSGNDTFVGGAGGDAIDGGTGNDTASYAGSAAGVNVQLQYNIAQGGDAAGDTLTSIERLTGSDHNDTLFGSPATNIIRGGGGNDHIKGLNGADNLYGDLGDDWLYVDSLDNIARGGGGTDRMIVVGSGGVTNTVGVNSIEIAIGNVGNDTFDGTGAAADLTLKGLSGNDVLTGGNGDDYL